MTIATERARTQYDDIAEASTAYIVPLNNPSDAMATHRFAVYLLAASGRLSVLWPNPDEKKLLPLQVKTSRRQYPAFHFALDGCGYSKEYEIKQILAGINPEIAVYSLTGYCPSNV